MKGPLLVIAPHPDDELIACGGMLAAHAARGDAVRVLVLTRDADAVVAKQREGECEAGLRSLGVEEVRFLDHADGALAAGTATLEEQLAAETARLAASRAAARRAVSAARCSSSVSTCVTMSAVEARTSSISAWAWKVLR